MALQLPRSQPGPGPGYLSLLGSLAGLWREFATLRLASITQAFLFATFIVFWTILALHLQEPRFHLGAEIAGLFGVVGAVGVLAAPLAGRLADRNGPGTVIALGSIIAVVAWLVFAFWDSVAGLVAGVILLDLAVQSSLVSHQHVIYALRPAARLPHQHNLRRHDVFRRCWRLRSRNARLEQCGLGGRMPSRWRLGDGCYIASIRRPAAASGLTPLNATSDCSRMRLVLAVIIAACVGIPPASASRTRDGFGTSSRCHCDRYLNPHYTGRARPATGGAPYRGTASRRYLTHAVEH